MTAYPGRPPLRRVVPALLHDSWGGAPKQMKVMVVALGGALVALLGIWLGHVLDVPIVSAWIGLLIYVPIALAMGAAMNVVTR
jgi:hypothetical protein